MNHTPPSPLARLRRALPGLALAVSAGLFGTAAHAQAPRAGTSIGNQATATYSDGSAINRSVQSNDVTTVVTQVAAVSLIAPRAISAAPGSPVYLPHTVQNNGNGLDTFGLAVVEATNDQYDIGYKIYADANQDGVPDNNTVITQTPALQPGEKFNFVIAGAVPSTRTSGDIANLTVTARSVFTTTLAANNADSVTVSSNAVVNLRKSLDKNSGTIANNPYTYTLRYTNNSNVPAGSVVISDTLTQGLDYVPASGRWSVAGTTALDDANGGDPTGIEYTYNAATRTITATITSVPARSVGAVTFSVNIAQGTKPGVLPNTASLSYDDDNNTTTPPKTDNSNTVDLTVNQAPALTFTGQTLPTANQGATLNFTNPLVNNGNGVDTFDIVVDPASSTFPAGTTFQLFQSDGAATLLDSNGNSTPDTGPVAPGATYNVILRAILPPNSSATGPFSVNLIATSSAPTKPTATATDRVNTVNAATVQLTNNDGAGDRTLGAGDLTPAGSPVISRTGAPGTTVRFPLTATNQSGTNDNYALSFAPVNPLPAGTTVVFRDGTGKVITNTGNIAPGGFFDYFADVTIPAGATPQTDEILFTVTSGASGASDTIRDSLTVAAVRSITVTPNNNGQVFPGSSVNYAQTVTNNGNQTETQIAVATTGDANGFSSVVYADINGNGVLDPEDQAAGPLTTIPSLTAGASFKVIVQVFGPSSEFQSGQVNQTVLSATASGANAPSGSATDTTTIVSGDLRLEKFQSVNGAANTKGSASAAPGATIRYTILVTNTGGAAVTGIVVSDNTPAYTKYSTGDGTATPAGSAVYTTDGGATYTAASQAPGNNTAGTLRWTIPSLAPGASATVTFNVTINN